MRKINKNRSLNERIDDTTIAKVKLIIWICIVVALFLEFIPDILDKFKLFENCKSVLYFKAHIDFFINCALGCLGSAIISYFMLIISYRTKEGEKKEKIVGYLDKMLFNCVSLCNDITTITHKNELSDEPLYIQVMEDRIKSENKEIYVLFEKITDTYRTCDSEILEVETMKKLCEEKIIPIHKKIEWFCEILEQIVYNESDEGKKTSIKKEAYKWLLENLDKQYNLKKLETELLNINLQSVILQRVNHLKMTIIEDYEKNEECNYKNICFYTIYSIKRHVDDEAIKEKYEQIRDEYKEDRIEDKVKKDD